MAQKIIQQGAEAVIYLDISKGIITKNRIKKSYRHPLLDEKIRKLRTKSEIKLMEKASGIISVPKPIGSYDMADFQIKMPYVDGKKLSEWLDKFSLSKQKQICKNIGESVAMLHKNDIIHGDLTTSNMIYATNKSKKSANDKKQIDKIINVKDKVSNAGLGIENFKIFFIDFGLGFISNKIEDQAVDIHLFKEALEARHFRHWKSLFSEFLNGYKKYARHKKVTERMVVIEKRGRYRS